MIINKGKRLCDSDNKEYIVVDIYDDMTILYNHGPKEFIVTRPLLLDSEGHIILDRPGVWWCWSYSDAIRLVEYIKYNG